MRLWSIDILKFLPDLQFKGQLREMMLILHQWRDEGKTNHLLINKVMEYPKNDFARYFLHYEALYHERYGKWLIKQWEEFKAFDDTPLEEISNGVFEGWHNKEYLRVCLSNLYEKHTFGIGKSRITDEEWEWLCYGYKKITGEEYSI
jgi:uncharacterized protein (TIGR02328 family)